MTIKIYFDESFLSDDEYDMLTDLNPYFDSSDTKNKDGMNIGELIEDTNDISLINAQKAIDCMLGWVDKNTIVDEGQPDMSIVNTRKYGKVLCVSNEIEVYDEDDTETRDVVYDALKNCIDDFEIEYLGISVE